MSASSGNRLTDRRSGVGVFADTTFRGDNGKRDKRFGRLLAGFVSLPVAAWLALWAAINTHPSNIEYIFSGELMATLNGVRAASPLLVLAVGLLWIGGKSRRLAPITSVEIGFWIYAVAMLTAGILVDPRFTVLYWALAFLATMVAARMFSRRGDPLLQAERLNWLTWFACSAILIILLIVARDQLFVGEGEQLSGYGIVSRVRTVGGGAMSRSSGMARFASVPAIIAFILFWRVKGALQWTIATGVFVGSVALVWFMQSRGAIFSLATALGFVMIFMGARTRIAGVVVLIIGLLVGTGDVTPEFKDYIVRHATRGEGAQVFEEMSGRHRIFRRAWDAIREEPFIGYGPQADRRIIRENAQNGPLYAWLNAGLIGVISYVGAMLAALYFFLRIMLGSYRLTPQQRDMLMMTGGIHVFFVLRSYPENTAALFSVDLMVQLPAMIYIAVLYRQLKRERAMLLRARRSFRR